MDSQQTLPEEDESDTFEHTICHPRLVGRPTTGRADRAGTGAVVWRFRNSQKPSGGWGYLYQTSAAAAKSWDTTTPAMTGAGLLGLAMSWGLADNGTEKKEQESLQDPAIRKGLEVLGHCVGLPAGRPLKPDEPPPPPDLYYLWSLERVGVLYNQKTLGDKDWYSWGSWLPARLPARGRQLVHCRLPRCHDRQ